ncbi:MAG: DUF1194 domain-containing protein [Rhodospirillales bacterium]|nr:DUF1194 domain-containing protein [Rhodospirillales bacterium]
MRRPPKPERRTGAPAPFLRLLALGFLLVLGLAARAEAQPVDLALVLAVDVSESVNAERYQLQIEGIARALEQPRLFEAIGAGEHGAIALLVMEWSDRDRQTVTVDWTRITDAASASLVAKRLRRSVRSSDGLTAIGDALFAAQASFGRLPWPAQRRAVDVSGDGMANIGPPPNAARDALVADGITINGLPILSEEPWLEFYYSDYVIGGPGAFIIPAEDYASFAEAMASKLLSEIAGLPPATRLAAGPSPSPGAGEGRLVMRQMQ